MFTINFPPRLDIVLKLMLFIIANNVTQYILIFCLLKQTNLAKCLLLSRELLDILHVDHAGRPAGHDPVCCPGMGHGPPPGPRRRLKLQNSGSCHGILILHHHQHQQKQSHVVKEQLVMSSHNNVQINWRVKIYLKCNKLHPPHLCGDLARTSRHSSHRFTQYKTSPLFFIIGWEQIKFSENDSNNIQNGHHIFHVSALRTTLR